uniref:BZIP domain-containing protein n=1 Tax=Caenorhabditis tropicalis TaxID=1561998 RepID=A0A1I7UUP6_9PELO
MSSTELFEIVVEYSEKPTSRHCSPNPSTSSSSASPASSSGSSTPSSTSSKNSRARRLTKAKKAVVASLRRSSRKIMTVGKKYGKRLSSSSAAKLRLVKYKIDKQQQQKIAESKARVERLKRETEDLLAGTSQVAILCEEVTTTARSLRESYERQRPNIYSTVLSNFLEQMEEEVYDDEEEGGFYGTFYF